MKSLNWILLAFLLYSIQPGSSLFFKQVDPQLSWTSFKESRASHIITAALDSDDSGFVVYSIDPSNVTTCPLLTINKTSGYVNLNFVPPGGSEFPNECHYNVFAKLEGQVGHRNKSEVKTMLTLREMSNQISFGCSQASHDHICFNGMKEIQVQVVENRKQEVLAVLGQEITRCQLMNFKYYVKISESNVLSIKEDESGYKLVVEPEMDREEQSEYTFSIECTRESKNPNQYKTAVIPGKLTILDEDDNSPKTQNKTNYEVYDISFLQTDNLFKPNRQVHPVNPTQLLVVDEDSSEVNNYDLLVLNDTWDLLRINKSMVNYNRATAVLLKVGLSEGAAGHKPWSGRYCVEARLNDTTLVITTESSIMTYLICLHWGDTRFHVPDSTAQPSQIVHGNDFCDTSCVVISFGIAGAFLAAFVLFVCWKTRFLQNKRRKCIPVKPGVLLRNNIIGGGGEDGNQSDLEYMSNANVRLGFHSSQHHDSDNYTMVDPKWEVDRTQLLLEQVLGEGEFGRVLKARMKRPDLPLGYANVAVKMLKDNHVENGKSSRQEFVAEFVLLKQVDHPNVIKLLGACTAPGGPLYLIMEYAELGSLRSFLRKCRRIENLNENIVNSEVGLNSTLDSSKYIISPNEILGFSWQIAKGMTYLSDMKMVHRDIAARNILLTESKLCKISDFGLTRDIYVDDAYKKKSKDRVPVKWLAPECLADELYTTKSDVWAYGVLLWELVTLGTSPYPGIQTEQIYPLLKSGYRMQQPPNCSFELYSMMRTCWAIDPQNRPSFREISLSLSKLLEDGIDYLKLDIPVVSNPGYQYFNDPEQRETAITDDQIPEVAFENTQLITPPLETNDTSKSNQLTYSNILPTYINCLNSGNPQEEKGNGEEASQRKLLNVDSNPHGYESPIIIPKNIGVTD